MNVLSVRRQMPVMRTVRIVQTENETGHGSSVMRRT